MKQAILITAFVVLAACNGAEDGASQVDDVAHADGAGEGEIPLAGEEPGFEAVAPGNYEVVMEGGEVHQLTIHPGMTWSMVFADGDAAGETIYMQDGETCFVTEGEEGADCFTPGEIGEDGSMVNISTDGTVMTVGDRQVEPGTEI